MNRWQKIFLAIGCIVVIWVIWAGVRGWQYYEASGYKSKMSQVKEDFVSSFPIPYSSQNEEVSDDTIGTVLSERDNVVDSMGASLRKDGRWAIVLSYEWHKQGYDIETHDPMVLIFK